MEDSEKQRPRRTMLRFDRDGMVIPVWGILTIDKDVAINDNTCHMQYQIIINKGMETGTPQCVIGERRLIYYNEQRRDEAYECILSQLEESGVEFVTLN